MNAATPLHRPRHPVRFVTAASLFDGHDAAINLIRRLLQAQGAEVVHLGHDRSVEEVVAAVLEEDVQGVAISSYQGGHLEYFTYLLGRLRDAGLGHVRVYGGGGGVITPDEIDELHRRGAARIFSPRDGQDLGLARMVNVLIEECDVTLAEPASVEVADVEAGSSRALARAITLLHAGAASNTFRDAVRAAGRRRPAPVLGVTGTGGAGKSSLTDELLRRCRLDQADTLRIAVIAIDPTRRRGGGALLGDRIRMNAIDGPNVFFRSLATRGAQQEVPAALGDIVAAAKAWGADLVIVETPGIGQGDAAIVPHVDISVYVMTPEFGSSTQLEKIDMLDFADVVVINKFDRRGGADALRDVRRQYARNHDLVTTDLEQLPVFGTIAARFADDGVTALYHHLCDLLGERGARVGPRTLPRPTTKVSSQLAAIVPPSRRRHLEEIATTVRAYHARTDHLVDAVRRLDHLDGAATVLHTARLNDASARHHRAEPADAAALVERLAADARDALDPDAAELLAAWEAQRGELSGPDRPAGQSLAGTSVPKLALPRFEDRATLLRWLRAEHLPGHFPFTAGVFPYKRTAEEPARMFAGEGGPARTNRRFKLLADGRPATRLSTAFDSVTLYGADPAERPDIYGKIGNSGVSVATLDDMRDLFDGFDLCDPSTSVSMTINGPAPAILAMFLNTAIAQRPDLGPDEVLRRVRGTVQADILKEDQGQNTCIFSTEFALRMMADVQEWFIEHEVRNFYSVSISGYHIAEAGANPISQLAFTLANGFTYVEAYLARGMHIDDFAPNLSFFFSNGMDPEYTVLGRVARRIWAITMRDRYGAGPRAQKLKYHVQTSGRSLHAQEMAFNDIRTTLQALCAISDNANSLHTNAYDEAVTTPTDESVRRALAIQLIIDREWGPMMNENPLQGSFIVDELTELVEAAVLDELDRISARGGVLGAMERGYQRGRIQDESMRYEQRKHDGSLPIIGVNTFVGHDHAQPPVVELARSSDAEKRDQIDRLRRFQHRHAGDRPAALARLRDAALRGDNIFAVLMDTVRTCSLGEITGALFEVGGRYRRNL